MPTLMIYGANGYSGEMIAREAKKRGLRPILAARNAAAVQSLADELKFKQRTFDLADAASIDLSSIDVVLNCAGPFSKTAAPMITACIKAGVHYLDITGEISVFAYAHSQSATAMAAGVVLCPGVGFDVVPTDCLAALLKRALPAATDLVLAFDGGGGMSRGTAKTSVEGLKSGGMARIDGKMTPVPLAWQVAEFEFAPGRKRTAMTIPWGDVYTAFVSTGIPNIKVFMALPKAAIASARRLRWLAPILGLAPMQSLLKWRINQREPGPSEQLREKTRSYIVGTATAANGESVSGHLETANGYSLTVDSALTIAQYVLDGIGKKDCGYQTPATLCGHELLQRLQATQVEIYPVIRA